MAAEDVSARWPLAYARRVRVATRYMFPDQADVAAVHCVRVGVTVAEHYGRRLDPVAVRLSAYNADYRDSEGRAGWSVGTHGDGSLNIDTRRWNGHLVGMLDGRWLVDFAAQQLHRPERGIEITSPTVAAVDLDQLVGGFVTARGPDGPWMAYQAVGDTRWRSFRAWHEELPAYRVAANMAIAALAGVPQ
jgi:hypothetical protein